MPPFNGTSGNDVLFDGAGDDTMNGLAGHDKLYASDGNDTVDGSGGADRMVGGNGDDSYTVDNAGDAVSESSRRGTDTVRTSLAYILPDHAENLVLTGGGHVNGTGNALANAISGNDRA